MVKGILFAWQHSNRSLGLTRWRQHRLRYRCESQDRAKDCMLLWHRSCRQSKSAGNAWYTSLRSSTWSQGRQGSRDFEVLKGRVPKLHKEATCSGRRLWKWASARRFGRHTGIELDCLFRPESLWSRFIVHCSCCKLPFDWTAYLWMVFLLFLTRLGYWFLWSLGRSWRSSRFCWSPGISEFGWYRVQGGLLRTGTEPFRFVIEES